MKMTTWRSVFCFSAFFTCLFVSAFHFPSASAQGANCFDESETTSYFRRLALVESMAETINGIGPITQEHTRSIAHFRIVENGCGDTMSVGYFHGEKPKPIDDNFTGNIFTPASQTIVRNDGAQTTVRFFDLAGKPANTPEGIDSVAMIRDVRGRVTQVAFRDSQGALTNGPAGYAIANWQWNGANSAVETRFNAEKNAVVSGNGIRFSSAQLTFGKLGLLDEIRVGEDGPVVRYERYKTGSIKSWKAYDRNGAPRLIAPANVHGAEYVYDENQYLVRLKYFDESEAPTISAFGHMGFAREYAENGNRLSYHFVNAEGERWAPPQRGYAGQNYTWRNDGVVRKRASYVDEDGALINHPQRNYAEILYEFDEQNFVAKRVFRDSNGTLLYASIP